MMYDDEIEKAMLSHILYNGYECDLTENDFINAKNKLIINVINELKQKKDNVSMMTVKQKIKGDGPRILAYLTSLPEYAIGTDADDLYNKIVQKRKKRAIFDILQKNILNIQNADAEEIVKNFTTEATAIMQRNQKEETFFDQLIKTQQDIESRYQKRNDYSLYTGITDLDRKMLGLHNGELTIIGARPRSRKNDICIANWTKNSRET